MNVVRYDIQFYSSLNLQTNSGDTFITSNGTGSNFQDDVTAADTNLSYIHGSGGVQVLRIAEDDDPNLAAQSGSTESGQQFSDGLSNTTQALVFETTIFFADQNSNSTFITLPAGAKVQSEHLYSFDNGYSISKVRI